MAKRARKKHYFFIKVSGKKAVRIGVNVSDAKTPVMLTRTVADILRGTEGMAVTCANAECALRQTGSFPHPAHFVSFTDNRAYVVDKIDREGRLKHAIRYAHNEGAFQKKFDRLGK